jgi:hypothetical protein
MVMRTVPWTAVPCSTEGIETELSGAAGGAGLGVVVVVVVVAVAVGGVLVVGVVLRVVPVVAVVVVSVVVEPGAWTTTVAVINGCRSQWNVYVPGVLNVQVPLHPGAVAEWGTGGANPLLAPAVWAQLAGCGPLAKSALCALAPLGYPNVTVPPCAIVACVLPGLPFASQAKSTAVKVALLGGESPEARLGTTAVAPPSSPAAGSTTARMKLRARNAA